MAKKGGKSMGSGKLGSWAFLIGVILAVIFGIIGQADPWLLWLLVLIGLVVGFLNVTDEESTPFMMSGAVLIIASAFGQDVMGSIEIASNILNALLAIFVPATVIVAIKNVFSLARN